MLNADWKVFSEMEDQKADENNTTARSQEDIDLVRASVVEESETLISRLSQQKNL